MYVTFKTVQNFKQIDYNLKTLNNSTVRNKHNKGMPISLRFIQIFVHGDDVWKCL